MLDINKLINDFFNSPSFESPSLFGDIKIKTGFDNNGDWKKQTYRSKDGLIKMVTYYQTSSPENSELSDLRNDLKNAIDEQDFEKAITLRDKIKGLKDEQNKIFELEKSLNESIDSENFELAIELRDKLKNLKTK